jgi:predicted metal-dependent hydrolase
MFGIIRRRRIIYTDKSKILFRNGQTVTVLGKRFDLSVEQNIPIKCSVAKLNGNMVNIYIAAGTDRRRANEHVLNLARRAISTAVLPLVDQRVREFNSRYFDSVVGKIRLKDNMSNWGSCSARNNINLDFRLLFAPPEILDAVIVHELAHTKHRNHSREFHDAVSRAIPDSREKMRWLRQNGQRLTTDAVNLSYSPVHK